MSVDKPDSIATASVLIGFVRALNARVRDSPDDAGLALAELTVLGGIEKGYDLSSTLVRKLLIDAPRVSRIVDGFVTSGYVMRETDAEDRRRFRLRLTPAGYDRLVRGRSELSAAMDDLLRSLTDEERTSLEVIVVPGMRRVLAGETAIARDDIHDPATQEEPAISPAT